MDMIRKSSRKAAMEKAKRLSGGDPREKVDSSTFTPPDFMNPEVKTGLRPISKRAFKRGGKVAHLEGTKAHQHAGKKPRQHGGKALSADTLVNRSVKEANKSREGADRSPVGAMNKGGRAHKAAGGMRSERTEYEKDRRDSVDQGMNYRSDSQHNDDSLRKAVRKFENTAKETGYSNLKAGGRTKKKIGGILGGPMGGLIPMALNSMRDKDDKNRGGRTKKEHGGMTGDPRASMLKQMESSNRAGVPSGLIPSKGGISSRLSKSTGMKRGGAADLDGMKSGGAAHPDIAEDRKLIKQMIKSDAMKRSSHAHGGKTGHADDCRCKKCWGGAAEAKGDRIARATGGKAGKGGKTNIHINIAPSGGAGAMPPPAMSPRSIPVPPPQSGAGGPPMGGMPMGGMPMGGMPMPIPVPMGGGAGGPPPPPMGRKYGGRTSYPITTGSGGGNARIEKIDSYGATPPKRSLGR
jgi:hypothetical protein